MEVLLIASLMYAAIRSGVRTGASSAKATWDRRRPDRHKKREKRRKRWERAGLIGWSLVQLERAVIGSARLGWDVGAATVNAVRDGVPAARSEWRTTWAKNHPEPGPDQPDQTSGEGGPDPVRTTPPDHPAEAARDPWPNTPLITEGAPAERFRLSVRLPDGARDESAFASRLPAVAATEAAKRWAEAIMSPLPTDASGLLFRRSKKGASEQLVATIPGRTLAPEPVLAVGGGLYPALKTTIAHAPSAHPSGIPGEERRECDWCERGPQETTRGKLKVCGQCASEIDGQIGAAVDRGPNPDRAAFSASIRHTSGDCEQCGRLLEGADSVATLRGRYCAACSLALPTEEGSICINDDGSIGPVAYQGTPKAAMKETAREALGLHIDPRTPICTYCGHRRRNWIYREGNVACPGCVKHLPDEPGAWPEPLNQCAAMVEREFPKLFTNRYGSTDVIGRETRIVRCGNEAAADGPYCQEHGRAPGPLAGGGCRAAVQVRPPGLDALLRIGMGHPDDLMDAPCPNQATGPDGYCDDHRPGDTGGEPLKPGPRPVDGSTTGAPAPAGTTTSTEGTRMSLRDIVNHPKAGGRTEADFAKARGAALTRPAGGEAEVDDLATLKRIAAQVVQQREDSEFMKIIAMCQTLPEGTDFGDRVGKVLAEFAQACVSLGKVGDEVAEMAPSVSAIAEHVRGED